MLFLPLRGKTEYCCKPCYNAAYAPKQKKKYDENKKIKKYAAALKSKKFIDLKTGVKRIVVVLKLPAMMRMNSHFDNELVLDCIEENGNKLKKNETEFFTSNISLLTQLKPIIQAAEANKRKYVKVSILPPRGYEGAYVVKELKYKQVFK